MALKGAKWHECVWGRSRRPNPGGLAASAASLLTHEDSSCSVSYFSFNKIVIFGVGLIGGSLALALKRGQPGAPAAGCIVGVGRSAASVERALALGVIDLALGLDDDAGLEAALRDADVVICAAPVAQTEPLLRRMAPWLRGQTLVSDVGSTKADAVAAARAALGAEAWRFVPAHPIAGRELSGVEAALVDLFHERDVVLCPLAENPPQAPARIAAMWQACGAHTLSLSAAQHDAVFASVSHLPHVLAFALLEQILRGSDAQLKLDLAGSGFRDFTRIAAASPEMWRDICVANRAALLSDLDAYQAVLQELRQLIADGDTAALHTVFGRASAAREAWSAGGVIHDTARDATLADAGDTLAAVAPGGLKLLD